MTDEALLVPTVTRSSVANLARQILTLLSDQVTGPLSGRRT